MKNKLKTPKTSLIHIIERKNKEIKELKAELKRIENGLITNQFMIEKNNREIRKIEHIIQNLTNFAPNEERQKPNGFLDN